MKIEDVAHILRASKAITGETTFVMVGSQAILAQFPNAPDALKMSMEIDMWPRFKPEMSEIIEGALGADSSFHRTFGYCADGIGPETAILPDGWDARCVELKGHPLLEGAIGVCPEIHDICASKLMAFREKDLEWVQAAIDAGLVNPATIEARLEDVTSGNPAHKTAAISWVNSRKSEDIPEGSDGPE